MGYYTVWIKKRQPSSSSDVTLQEYPIATGYVHITSGTDPYAPPDFDPRYLTQ